MTALAHLALFALALPAVATCTYLFVLTLLSARLPLPAPSSRLLRFDVIVPAHNEVAVIERVLSSLNRLHWPPQHVRLIVVADNCDDATAQLARAAGARVLERHDTKLRSKGYALQLAFEYSRESGWADAVVVIDADAEVSSNMLEAFAARIEAGAGVVQAHYGVLNPTESWRTRLIAIAHGAFHRVRSRARERLRLSCGLRGNGWCITHRVLDEVPYRAFSLTEDLEYGIELGLAGHRVQYADEAYANAEMASSEQIARRQRQRWEDGRFALIRSQTLPLLLAAVQSTKRERWRPLLLNNDARRRCVCLDLALDLLVLPLSYVALNVAVLIVAAGVALLWHAELRVWLWPSLVSAIFLLLYVLRGWQLSGSGTRGLLDLLCAPLFVIWKILRVLRHHEKPQWVPTKRQAKSGPPVPSSASDDSVEQRAGTPSPVTPATLGRPVRQRP